MEMENVALPLPPAMCSVIQIPPMRRCDMLRMIRRHVAPADGPADDLGAHAALQVALCIAQRPLMPRVVGMDPGSAAASLLSSGMLREGELSTVLLFSSGSSSRSRNTAAEYMQYSLPYMYERMLLRRAELWQWLMEAMRSRSGVVLHTGSSCCAVRGLVQGEQDGAQERWLLLQHYPGQWRWRRLHSLVSTFCMGLEVKRIMGWAHTIEE